MQYLTSHGKMPQNPPKVISEVMLSKEFGWTPSQISSQDSKKIQEYTIVLNQISKYEDREKKKKKREINRKRRG